jgi:histidinol-phosphatase (PHP family)
LKKERREDMDSGLLDLHSHSLFSFDAKDTDLAMVMAAARKGLRYYALTEHLDINLYHDPEYNMKNNISESDSHIKALKQQFEHQLTLLYGVEIAQPAYDKALTDTLLDTYHWDFIIGSCHMVRGYDDFYFINYEETDPVMLMDRYFDEMLEMAELDCFDVLGHLTYPLRYIEGNYGMHLDMTRYHSIIDKIFLTLIKNDKGIEINTSGLRQKIGKTLPDYAYVKRFYDLGGRILTIGSDAHFAEDVGSGISQGIQIAKDAGFNQVTYFQQRKPVFISI